MALLAKQGETYIHLVTIKATGLDSIKITEDDLTGDWAEVMGYSPEKAYSSFVDIAQTVGCTKRAAKLLDLNDFKGVEE